MKQKNMGNQDNAKYQPSKHEQSIVWLRQDLRCHDNPALYAAAKIGAIIPIYIFDEINAGKYCMGAASKWWLHHSLNDLNEQLAGQLNIYQGDAKQIILQLVQRFNIQHVFWNRCYEPWRIQRDTHIMKILKENKIKVTTFNASLLWEPWDIYKSDGQAYKVFTPYYKNAYLNAPPPRIPLEKPKHFNLITDHKSLSIDQLALLPKQNWDKKFYCHWQVSEQAAINQLKMFLQKGIHDYKNGRNFPAKNHTSHLSPYLHFGNISVNQIWHAVLQLKNNEDRQTFLSELGWREFSYYLLYHFPELPEKNWNNKFDNFAWQVNRKLLTAWQLGQTGYPIIDAGMRELWQTGYMHNRIRMIVASFLTKNCLIDWREGEKWFWDCLLDADLASNSASWQWVAGCGADAAPYFRIFNPISQGQKFDADGEYTKYYVPELAKLPNKYLFNPWEAPNSILKQANVILGSDYPLPIIDLKLSRETALNTYRGLIS